MAKDPEVVTLRSPRVSVEVQTYGAQISHLSGSDGRNLLATRDWLSPVPPGETLGYGSSIADFHAESSGGWHLLFPNSGYECDVLGTTLPFHGEVARQHWEIDRLGKTSVALHASARLPLSIKRTISLSDASLRVVDDISNEGAVTIPFLLGHHPVFPLSSEIQLDLPDGSWQEISSAGLLSKNPFDHLDQPHPLDNVLPALETPWAGLFTLSRFSSGWYAVRGIYGSSGVAVAWDVAQLPHLWLWLENQSPEFPWFGRAQYLGVEPQRSSTPEGLAGSIGRGEHCELKPGESVSFPIEVFVLDDIARPVQHVQFGSGPVW